MKVFVAQIHNENVETVEQLSTPLNKNLPNTHPRGSPIFNGGWLRNLAVRQHSCFMYRTLFVRHEFVCIRVYRTSSYCLLLQRQRSKECLQLQKRNSM